MLRVVTPDVLAEHLPRPLWARLFMACLGAPRVDAQLVVETIGVPNLCEHLPVALIWQCLATVAARELDAVITSAPAPTAMPARAAAATVTTVVSPPPQPSSAAGSGEWARSGPSPLSLAPPPAPEVRGASAGSKPNLAPPPSTPIPAPLAPPPDADLLGMLDELDEDPIAPPPIAAASPGGRGRASRQPFRAASTASGARATAHTTRRPQAQAAPAPSVTPPTRRSQTELNEYDIATDVRSAEDFSDDQLVDWSAAEETVTGGDDGAGGGDQRKR